MTSITLVSINIERSKHLEQVLPFIEKNNPDVVTLQEVMDRDIPALEKVAGKLVHHTPLCIFLDRPQEEPEGVYGQAIFSKHPVVQKSQHYYAGDADPLYSYGRDAVSAIARVARALTVAQIDIGGHVFTAATTHFTWSEGGKATESQSIDLVALLALLREIPEFVLTGDFNAPRGLATWEKIASVYKDNIPQKYSWSLDLQLHAKGPFIERDVKKANMEGFMVDGLFTTPGYLAKNVELHTGISDHCAVTAKISQK